MKSKFTLLVFSLVFSFKLFGQTLLQDGMKYYFLNFKDDIGGRYYYTSESIVYQDSIMGDYKYYHLQGMTGIQVMIHNNQYYFKYNPDSNYQLIYDFNLKAGDYMKGNNYIDSLRIDSVQNLVIDNDSFIIQYVTVTKALSLYPRNFRFVNRFGSLEAGIEYWEHFFFEYGTELLGICGQNASLRWQDTPTLHFTKTKTCNTMDSVMHALSVKAIHTNLKVKLSPNPVTHQLTIETFQSNEPIDAAIYNSLGILVYQTKSSDVVNTIDLSHLPNGLYIIKISTSDNQYSTQKIIKQ